MAPNPAYDPIIDEASRRFNVPTETIRSVMGVESSGRRHAVSPKGASGLMQVMPETYNELARKHGLGPDRFEPRNNIMAGTAYLRENNDRFGGDWTKTLQAYNAGPGAVESGRPLPKETQAYVPKVQAGMGLTREAATSAHPRSGHQ
jgi:soluble lytic murein transglycosylase-like protein